MHVVCCWRRSEAFAPLKKNNNNINGLAVPDLSPCFELNFFNARGRLIAVTSMLSLFYKGSLSLDEWYSEENLRSMLLPVGTTQSDWGTSYLYSICHSLRKVWNTYVRCNDARILEVSRKKDWPTDCGKFGNVTRKKDVILDGLIIKHDCCLSIHILCLLPSQDSILLSAISAVDCTIIHFCESLNDCFSIYSTIESQDHILSICVGSTWHSHAHCDANCFCYRNPCSRRVFL